MATPKSATSRTAAGAPKGSTAGAAVAALTLILSTIFGHEGEFVDHPDDPGGATNHGCTEAVARANGYTGSMRAMPQKVCQDILERQFVVKPGFMPLVAIDPALAHEIIDTGVNAGTRRPSCWFQEGLNAFNRKQVDYPDIAVDCSIGPATVAAYRSLRARRGPLACELMMKYLDGKQLEHYASLGRNNSRFESFMIGWVDTRIGNVPFQACYTGKAI